MKQFHLFLTVLFFMTSISYSQVTLLQKRERDNLYNRGIENIQGGELLDASEYFSRCIEIDNRFAPAYLQRARISIEQGLNDAAMTDLDRATELDDKFGEAWFYKGYLLFNTDTGLALKMFDEAIQSGFNDPYAYYLRGLSHLYDGQESRALKDFNSAIALKPDFALAFHDRAGLKREKGDLQGALFDYKTATDLNPEFSLAFNNMGSVKIMMGDYQGGIADYTRAIELNPDMFMAYNNRGCARYHLGDYETALEDFNMAALLNGSFSVAKMNKANSLAMKQDYDAALKVLNETINDLTDNALLFVNRGLIRELTGDKPGACSDWQKALDLGYTKAAEYLEECN